MGWTGKFNRRQYVADYKRGWTNDTFYDNEKQDWYPRVIPQTVTVKKHHAIRNEDWFLIEVRENGQLVEQAISLALWDGTYVKNMDETVGPAYYGCPVAWFDEVPLPVNTYAQSWRDKVRALHQKEAA